MAIETRTADLYFARTSRSSLPKASSKGRSTARRLRRRTRSRWDLVARRKDRRTQATKTPASEGMAQAADRQDEAPGQGAGQDAFDDRLHQRGLRRGQVAAAEAVGAAEEQHGRGHRPAGEGGADELAELLLPGRRADEVAGLQIL